MANKYEWIARKRNYDQEIKSCIRIPTSLHPLRQITSTTTSIGALRPLSQSSRSSSASSLNTQSAGKSIGNHNFGEAKEQKFVDPLGVAIAAENAGSSLLGVGNISDSVSDDPLSSSYRSNSSSGKETGQKTRRHVMDNSLVENGEESKNGFNGTDHIDGTSSIILEGFESWSTKRTTILQKYTTNEKLSIVTSFLPGGIPLQTQVTVTDKLKHR